jgi:hypothetical protein
MNPSPKLHFCKTLNRLDYSTWSKAFSASRDITARSTLDNLREYIMLKKHLILKNEFLLGRKPVWSELTNLPTKVLSWLDRVLLKYFGLY